MYPHPFRPSTVCSVYDARGEHENNCDVQIFKPLLACTFNGPQPLILDVSIPNFGGIIQRALIRVPDDSFVDLRPGPSHWAAGQTPYHILDEDPNADKWYWSDALPWEYGGHSHLWSVYAHKAPAVPPPPPPPTIDLSSMIGTSTLLTNNQEYLTIIPPLSQGYGYIPVATGIGYALTLFGSYPSTSNDGGYGGNHSGMTIIERTPPPGGPAVSFTVAGISHTGPDAIIVLYNSGMSPLTYDFKLSSP